MAVTARVSAIDDLRLREMKMVPIRIASCREVKLSPGVHSELIRKIWEEFGPRFVPGGELVYAGDTGDKWGYFNEELLKSKGVTVDNHGKMPDVVIHFPEKDWLILAEAVTIRNWQRSRRNVWSTSSCTRWRTSSNQLTLGDSSR